jgi:hypothetical protein
LEKQIQRYLHESVSFSETQYALALSYPGAREEFEEYQRQLQANNVQFEKKGNSTIIIGPNAEFGLVNHPLLLKVVDAKTDNFSLWPADTKFPFIDRTAKTGEGAKPTRGK